MLILLFLTPDIGPFPGWLVLLAGTVYIALGVGLVVRVNGVDRKRGKERAVGGSWMG